MHTLPSPGTDACPCGSGQAYAGCQVAGTPVAALEAPSPEALMRSRYGAYVLGLTATCWTPGTPTPGRPRWNLARPGCAGWGWNCAPNACWTPTTAR